MKKTLLFLSFTILLLSFSVNASASIQNDNWWGCNSIFSKAVSFLSDKLGIPLAYAQTCNWTAVPVCALQAVKASGGAAYASSVYNGYSAANAADNSIGTVWGSDTTPSAAIQWLAIKLVAPQAVTRVRLYPNSVRPSANFKNFSITASNDSTNGGNGTWNTLASGLNTSNAAQWDQFDFSNSNSYLWYRLIGLSQSQSLGKGGSGYLIDVAEYELYYPGGASAIARTSFSWPDYPDSCGGASSYALTVTPSGSYTTTAASYTLDLSPSTAYSWNVAANGTFSYSGSCVSGSATPASPGPQSFSTPACNPVTVDIKANSSDGPITIPAGTAATLSWTSANADACTASGNWSGAKATGGSESTGNLNANKTYTITCVNTFSSANDSVAVNIGPPSGFTLNQPAGGSVQCNSIGLTWSASAGADGYRVLKGSPRVTIATTTALAYTDYGVSENSSYRYQVEAFNIMGTQRSNTVNTSTPYCPPTVDLKCNGSDGPVTVTIGSPCFLSWTSAYASACIASGGWSGSKALSGSQTSLPLTGPTTFTLICTGPGGSSAPLDSVQVNTTGFPLPGWIEIIPQP